MVFFLWIEEVKKTFFVYNLTFHSLDKVVLKLEIINNVENYKTTAATVVSRRCFILEWLSILHPSCRREGLEAPFGPERRGVKGGCSDGSLLSSGKVV